jgi:hypothetical protein
LMLLISIFQSGGIICLTTGRYLITTELPFFSVEYIEGTL